jgi:hypothetical protein
MHFGQVYEPVIDGKQHQTLQRHKDMILETKTHIQAPHFATYSQHHRSRDKTVENRDHGINTAQLKFDRQPGRTPYDNG